MSPGFFLRSICMKGSILSKILLPPTFRIISSSFSPTFAATPPFATCLSNRPFVFGLIFSRNSGDCPQISSTAACMVGVTTVVFFSIKERMAVGGMAEAMP